MRLVLDPADEAAHADWLRGTPGAYEWWYFDALSDDGRWALACIWFLGNPFSPFYADAARGRAGDPVAENAVFFALYQDGKLHAYHFTRFGSGVETGGAPPTCLRFGPNALSLSDGEWRLTLADENGNGRRLDAVLTFTAPPLQAAGARTDGFDGDHSWLPAGPVCRVAGAITLREPHNPGAEAVRFVGTGYHDHNWGRLPFDAAIHDWYWARAALGGEGAGSGRAVILYHVRPRGGRPPVSHLLLFEGGRLRRHETEARVSLSRRVLSGLGAVYATRLVAKAEGLRAEFTLEGRLDSAPFYVRALCRATVREGAGTEEKRDGGRGMGEYLRPRMMGWPLVASAMKARIVRRG